MYYRNIKFICVLIIMILLAVSMCIPAFATQESLAKLDAAGNQLLYLARKIAFWVVTIIASYKVIQCALKGSKKEVLEILLTYVLIYGTMYVVPWAMRLVEDIF